MYVVVEDNCAGLYVHGQPCGPDVYDDLESAAAACIEWQDGADGAGHPAWFRVFQLREVERL